jgi:hypothetical protein
VSGRWQSRTSAKEVQKRSPTLLAVLAVGVPLAVSGCVSERQVTAVYPRVISRGELVVERDQPIRVGLEESRPCRVPRRPGRRLRLCFARGDSAGEWFHGNPIGRAELLDTPDRQHLPETGPRSVRVSRQPGRQESEMAHGDCHQRGPHSLPPDPRAAPRSGPASGPPGTGFGAPAGLPYNPPPLDSPGHR